MRQAVAAQPRSARTSERLFDLAVATEYCDPDRSLPLALYMEAWRGGHTPARDRAWALATRLRAHVTLAELALAAHDHLAAATAYLDAGFPELAVAPLETLVGKRPPNLDVVGTLLALARRSKLDTERAIADRLARTLDAAILALELRISDPGKLTQTSHRVNARIARRTDVGWGAAFVDPARELVAAIEAATE